MTEDRERLDWLESISRAIDVTIRAAPDFDHLHTRRLELVIGRAATVPGRSLREALDTAMRAIPAEKV